MSRYLSIVALLLGSVHAVAGPQWVWEAGKQTTNGAITLKSASGGGSYNGTRNPTGAVAKVNQSASTQPPTIIIQATASLPIHAAGDACTAADVSSAAGEGIAITEDRTLLLSCQSGSWAKAVAGVGSTIEPACLGSCTPPSCPAGWTDVGIISDFVTAAYGGNQYNTRRRHCSTAQSYRVIEPSCSSGGTCTPASCPGGWTDLGIVSEYLTAAYGGNTYSRRFRHCAQ